MGQAYHNFFFFLQIFTCLTLMITLWLKLLSHVRLFVTPWTARFFRLWDFPGKNTGVACNFLLQGIFPIQGSNPGLLHCRQTLDHLSHLGSLDKPYEKGIIVIMNLSYRWGKWGTEWLINLFTVTQLTRRSQGLNSSSLDPELDF